MTRVPVRGQEASNGRARLPGPFRTHVARISNLIVRTAKSEPLPALKQKANRDDPAAEQALRAARPQNGLSLRRHPGRPAPRSAIAFPRAGGGRIASSPVLVYRIYPDGREQLVRGLRFRGLSARSFKDITAASNEVAVFDYLDNGAPLALPAAASFAVGCSVVSPGLLFEDLELEAGDDDQPRRPGRSAPASLVARRSPSPGGR